MDFDFVCDHEGGVEADAELTDEGGVVLLTGILQSSGKGFGAGVGDGAEVFDELGAGHADAVIGDGQSAGGFIGGDGDFQRGGGVEDVVFRELGEAHFFHRIGSVGHQFADEDLAVGVKAVNNDIEDLFDFGLEFVGLAHGCVVFRRFGGGESSGWGSEVKCVGRGRGEAIGLRPDRLKAGLKYVPGAACWFWVWLGRFDRGRVRVGGRVGFCFGGGPWPVVALVEWP